MYHPLLQGRSGVGQGLRPSGLRLRVRGASCPIAAHRAAAASVCQRSVPAFANPPKQAGSKESDTHGLESHGILWLCDCFCCDDEHQYRVTVCGRDADAFPFQRPGTKQ
eukprot:2130600-Amphidinium_carterae.1